MLARAAKFTQLDEWTTMAIEPSVIFSGVSSVAAAVGLIFAGFQVNLLVRQRRTDERYQLEGVSVTWYATSSPPKAEPDGFANWDYRISVQNPGRYPISEVTVQLKWPMEVQRLHKHGPPEEPSRVLCLEGAPVIMGGGTRTWDRALRMDYRAKGRLSETKATIRFHAVGGRACQNTWPPAY